jgi:hypothetical protein
VGGSVDHNAGARVSCGKSLNGSGRHGTAEDRHEALSGASIEEASAVGSPTPYGVVALKSAAMGTSGSHCDGPRCDNLYRAKNICSAVVPNLAVVVVAPTPNLP